MFSNRLRDIRKSRQLTLEDLAILYNQNFEGGMNKGTLSKYENGKQEPMISVVTNLATLLDVSVDYLLGKTEDKKNKPINEDELDSLTLEILKIMDDLSPERKKAAVEQLRILAKF